LLTTQLKRKIK